MINKLFYCLLLFVSLVVVQGFVSFANDATPDGQEVNVEEELVPDREITYAEQLSPDWKVNWDLARTLYRDKKYPEALVQYEILFTQKENIDEARWEYLSILMYLKRWDNAKAELEKLLTADPENIRYHLAMASVSKETGDTESAVVQYTQLLERTLSSGEKILVLEGLISVYEILDQHDEIVVLLDQLISLKPQDATLFLKQAALELELGNATKAKDLCAKYEESYPQDIAVLSLQAHIEEKLRNSENASVYWQKIIGLDTGNQEAHQHLYLYYFENGNWSMSFNHLESLIKITPSDVGLLRQAAELSMLMGRTDRALEYYEYGLAVDPLNKDILEGKSKAQKILAEDLLALVENDGGKKLWQDLVNVTPDSAGVYREIANLLREQSKVKELAEVLILMNKQSPHDQLIYEELVSLLRQQGDIEGLSALEARKAALEKSEIE